MNNDKTEPTRQEATGKLMNEIAVGEASASQCGWIDEREIKREFEVM